MKKKLLLLSLSSVMLLAACGNKEKPAEDKKDGSAEKVEKVEKEKKLEKKTLKFDEVIEDNDQVKMTLSQVDATFDKERLEEYDLEQSRAYVITVSVENKTDTPLELYADSASMDGNMLKDNFFWSENYKVTPGNTTPFTINLDNFDIEDDEALPELEKQFGATIHWFDEEMDINGSVEFSAELSEGDEA